jgi:short-subunit dehydrogenase involved in D-alanine esterification of teichoic acids
MNNCVQGGQPARFAHPAHSPYYDYDDEIGYYSGVKVQGGRFFEVNSQLSPLNLSEGLVNNRGDCKMRVLVTGGTNGMGKGVAKVLAGIDNQIHEIIILCRSKERGEATLKELQAATKNNKISMVLCNLTKLSDVRKAIEEIRSQYETLDGLFVNAGLGYTAKRVETEDGMDPHFQVNYLSQFMLTLNLLDLLEKSENGGRVIFNVTKTGEIFWDDIQMKNKWGYEDAIHQAMVAKRIRLLKKWY